MKRIVYPFLMLVNLYANENFSKDTNIFDKPLENLVKENFLTANKIANQISNASSAVSIVTAEDIQNFGYQTLGEILGSMRGMHTSEDYVYTTIAGRGYSAPGDYAGRIAILIDGYRADDSLFGQSFFGNDAILDVSMIERVEYIPGGGSFGYSSGALLGVVNIITKKPESIDGTQISYTIGSHNTKNRRITYGKSFGNGFDLLVSLSDYLTDGRDYSYDNQGSVIEQNNQSSAQNHRIFVKGSYKDVSMSTGWVLRNKNIPTYPVTYINTDEPLNHIDKNGFVNLKYDFNIDRYNKASSTLWYGENSYSLTPPLSILDPAGDVAKLGANSKWYGTDLNIINTYISNHTIFLGLRYRNDEKMAAYQDYYHLGTTQRYQYYESTRKTYDISFYDNYFINPNFLLIFGANYEYSNDGYNATSPQIALIWNPTAHRVLKLSTGKTNRHTTPSEEIDNNPESAKTHELVYEEKFGNNKKLLLSAYKYNIYNRPLTYYTYDQKAIVNGLEAEYEYIISPDSRLHVSYAYQKSKCESSNEPLVNAPEHIAKFQYVSPVFLDYLQGSIEIQYLGSRRTDVNDVNKYAPAYTLVNTNIFSYSLLPNANISFSIKNLFNITYADASSRVLEINNKKEYPQDGRTYLFGLEYSF